MEKILWHTQELKDEFKSKTGKDLNIPQLLNNVRFKDAWISSKSRQPDKSERLRSQLRRLAEEIVKPKKSRDPRRSEYQIQGAKKRGDKRKNRSFSSEREVEGRMATSNPEDKWLKTSSMPEAQKTVEPKASAKVVTAPSSAKDTDTEIIEGEEDEPGSQDLSALQEAISSEGGADNDAKKRKINPSEYKPMEKDKRMHEYILWAHKGKEER